MNLPGGNEYDTFVSAMYHICFMHCLFVRRVSVHIMLHYILHIIPKSRPCFQFEGAKMPLRAWRPQI